MDYKIINNEEENRIEAIINSDRIGLIDYKISNNNILAVYHTEVNQEYEGNGIAAEMTKQLLNYIKEKKYKIKPYCSYTRVYIERNPEYQELVEK